MVTKCDMVDDVGDSYPYKIISQFNKWRAGGRVQSDSAQYVT